jgi:hypothetical protein
VTPDKAGDLLDGTTPGPWEWCEGKDQNGEFVALCGPDGADALRTWDGDLYASGIHGTDADKALAAAAPTLAAMIAGMREECGVTYEEVAGPTTFTYSEWADSAGKLLTPHTARLLAWDKVRAGYPNVRVVRRYVTKPEEA